MGQIIIIFKSKYIILYYDKTTYKNINNVVTL